VTLSISVATPGSSRLRRSREVPAPSWLEEFRSACSSLDFYYPSYAGSGALFRLSRRGGKPVPFAREDPKSHIEALQFADEASVFWTSSENRAWKDPRLVRADKGGGAPRILANAGNVVAADAHNFYSFDFASFGSRIARRARLPSNNQPAESTGKSYVEPIRDQASQLE